MLINFLPYTIPELLHFNQWKLRNFDYIIKLRQHDLTKNQNVRKKYSNFKTYNYLLTDIEISLDSSPPCRMAGLKHFIQ